MKNLEDARALKAMGLPPDTEVIEGGQLPERCEKLIESVLKAASRCRSAVYAYLTDPNDSTYSKLNRTHEKLGREIAKIPHRIGLMSRTASGSQTPRTLLSLPPLARVASLHSGNGLTSSPRLRTVRSLPERSIGRQNMNGRRRTKLVQILSNLKTRDFSNR